MGQYMITTIMNDRSYPSFPVRKGLPQKKNLWMMERWITDYASACTFPITPLSFIIHGPCSLGVTEVSIKLPLPLTTVCLPCKQDCLFAFSLTIHLRPYVVSSGKTTSVKVLSLVEYTQLSYKLCQFITHKIQTSYLFLDFLLESFSFLFSFCVNTKLLLHTFVLSLKKVWRDFQPLHPNISIHILLIIPYTFLLELTLRNHLTIKVSYVGGHFLYFHDLTEWFSSITLRRK